MTEDQVKGGNSAMFGDGSRPAPKAVQLTEEEYEILEERQSQRRAFLTGRTYCTTTPDLQEAGIYLPKEA